MSQAMDGRSQLKGMVVPAFATTIFGTVWLMLAASAIKGLDVARWLLFAIIIVVALVLAVRSGRFARQVRHTATGVSPLADRRKRVIYIGAIVFEAAFYLIGYNVLEAFHRLDLIVPLLAFAVGLHFLGLIPVFQTNRYISVAIIFCVAAIIGVFLPGLTGVSGFILDVRTLLVSLVCGLFLWYIAFRLLTQGNTFLREGQGGEGLAAATR